MAATALTTTTTKTPARSTTTTSNRRQKKMNLIPATPTNSLLHLVLLLLLLLLGGCTVDYYSAHAFSRPLVFPRQSPKSLVMSTTLRSVMSGDGMPTSSSSLSPSLENKNRKEDDHNGQYNTFDNTKKKNKEDEQDEEMMTTKKKRKYDGRLSRVALWHQQRRKQMIAQYGNAILELEQQSSQNVGLPLLVIGNAALLGLSLWCGSLPIPAVFGLAIFPGSILSLWQLQILHDCLHGTLLDKRQMASSRNKKLWEQRILFWGSLPCVFGYYLYLQYGHLSHHMAVGGGNGSVQDNDKSNENNKNKNNNNNISLQQLFNSSQIDFEDGDMLFVAHRMKLKGPIGPQIPIPSLFLRNIEKGNHSEHDDQQSSVSLQSQEQQQQEQRRFPLSISRTGFHFWQSQKPIRNAMVFATSFLLERYLLCWNDIVVAVTGRNYFFPNKPAAFHRQCATYTRCAVAMRLVLYMIAGWKSLLFLYWSETLWSLPPHPACAMFITNHGSSMSASGSVDNDHSCRPTSSTYAGAWYSILTLGTNYHCEHHDFPSIPFHLLGRLHQLAPSYYGMDIDHEEPRQNIFHIMKETFAEPMFYACTNANQLE